MNIFLKPLYFLWRLFLLSLIILFIFFKLIFLNKFTISIIMALVAYVNYPGSLDAITIEYVLIILCASFYCILILLFRRAIDRLFMRIIFELECGTPVDDFFNRMIK